MGRRRLALSYLRHLQASYDGATGTPSLRVAPDDTPDVRVDTIYNEARRALIRTYAHTRRRALDEEKAIRLRIPGWQPSPGEGPVAEWETEWRASGFFSSEGECELPETLESVRGVAANGCAVRAQSHSSV